MGIMLFTGIPLGLTTYGWSGALAVVFSLYLTYSIGQRRAKNGKGNLGCLGFGYVFLVVTILMVLTISVTIGIASSLRKTTKQLMDSERYTAQIVSYSSYESHDAEARTTTTMFTPTVAFFTTSGERVEHTLFYSSSHQPAVGDTVIVYYNELTGDSLTLGFNTYMLFFGTLVTIIVLIFAFWGVLLYGLNYNMDYYLKVVKTVAVNFFIPLVMILFDALLIYAFFYGNEIPLFATGLLVFFIVILTLGIWGYIKMILTHDMVWTKTGSSSWGANPVSKKKRESSWVKRD
ncbi:MULTISPECIES: hypothetical protein [unclassified Myroides]|uniref:hypothetical protein n=1 Tax=unclassified Myroides TaxID=2642485 RepID=UPI003D2F9136